MNLKDTYIKYWNIPSIDEFKKIWNKLISLGYLPKQDVVVAYEKLIIRKEDYKNRILEISSDGTFRLCSYSLTDEIRPIDILESNSMFCIKNNNAEKLSASDFEFPIESKLKRPYHVIEKQLNGMRYIISTNNNKEFMILIAKQLHGANRGLKKIDNCSSIDECIDKFNEYVID